MRKMISTTFTLAAALGLVAQVAGGPVELKPKFEPGQKVYIEIDEQVKQTVHAEMMGPNPVEMFSRSLYGFYQEPLAASDEGARLKLTVDRRLMQFTHPSLGDMAFDTDAGQTPSPDNSISLIAAPFVGKALTMTVKGNRVAKVEGFEALQSAIDASAKGDMFYQNVRRSIDEKALSKDLVESRLQIFPARKVSVGDTWTNTFTSDDAFLGKTVSEYKCKLDKLEQHDGHPLAYISYEATTRIAPGSEAPANPMGMTPTLKNMKTTGTVVFDVQRGLILSTRNGTSGTIEMMPPAADGDANATPAISVDVKNDVTSRTLEPAQREAEKKKHAAAAATAPSAKPEPHGG